MNRPTVPTKVNQYVSFDDGFIRGGFLNATLATTQDIVRVGKFITGLSNISKASDIKDTTLQTATKGILFLTKQLGLQQSNPRLEWQQNPDTIAPLLGGATRQFTGAGVLASIGGSAFGLHFDRAGLLGTIRDDQKYGGDINSTTSGVVWENNFGTGLDSNRKISKNSNNRLVRYLAKIAPPLSVFNPNERFDEFGNRISVAIGPQQPLEILDDEGNKPNLSKILDRYSGGANSVYGLGITTIRTSKDSKTIIDLADIGTPGIPGVTRKYFDGTGEWVEVPNPNYRPPQSTTTTYKKTPNLNEDEKKGQYLSKLANDFPSSTALKSFTVASTVTTEPPKTISEFQLTEKT